MIDLAGYVRPGDTVLWGQACAEPRTLTEALLDQRARIGAFRCWLGVPVTDTARPEHADHVRFVSYSGAGANRALYEAGALDVVPVHYSRYPWLLSTGPLRADVVLLLVPPPNPDGTYSLGLAADYLRPAIDTARVVIAEVSDRVPRTTGARPLAAADIDVLVRTDREPATAPPRPPDPVTVRLAERVAGLIEDGATVEVGVGGLADAVLTALRDKRNVRLHSGLLGDGAVELFEAGAVTEPATAGFLIGTRRLFDFADGNPLIEVHETRHTHDPARLAALPRFAAVNSAVEVDLTGAVNAEVAGGRYVGAVGGALDFLRAAAVSPGGLPIVALPSTARQRSRIVTALSGPATTARADAGLVVTEYGVADLRGATLRQRRERMLAIAHPDHRAALDG